MKCALYLAAFATGTASLQAQSPAGRWDLTAQEGGVSYPMWLELLPGPPAGGRLQGRFGHALPLTGVAIDSNRVTFFLPSEQRVPNPARVSLVVAGDQLTGEIVGSGGRTALTGRRAPSLVRALSPEWGQPIDLLAKGLAGWQPRSVGTRNGWTISNNELVNIPPSVDLVSLPRFTDFKLHLEVNVPPSGNSGIYLRGRHEVQVADNFGQEPDSRRMGGIYGQVTPMTLPARAAGEWQSFDIILVGRRVSVVLNGVMVVDNIEIPGITGGALDSDEAAPGPIMLQGDHTGVRYRNIRITPVR